MTSYLANKHLEDTLGKSTVRHKPLNKGDEYPGLAKVFLEDPTMRPKVFVGEREPNKPFSSLMTSDIEGAAGTESLFISRPRGTDPLRPNYKLQSCRPSSALPPRAHHDEAAPVRPRPPSASPGMYRSSNLNTSDIEGAQPMVTTIRERTSLSLSTSDIPGASPASIHSQPHFRPHVGLNPRDTNFNSKDINDYMVRRKRDLYQNEPIHGKDKAEEQERAMSARFKAQREAQLASIRAQKEGIPSDFEYTGLPHFQDPPTVAAEDKLRKKEQCAPSATVVDADRLEKEQREELAIQEQVLDAARDAHKYKRDVRPAFSARSSQAALSAHAREAADKAVSALSVDRAQVELLWNALKRYDREGSGKCTIKELGLALDQARINRTPRQMEALSRGLRDNTGLLAYNELSKRLLSASKGLPHSPPPPPQYKLFGQASSTPTSSPLAIQGTRVQQRPTTATPPPPSTPSPQLHASSTLTTADPPMASPSPTPIVPPPPPPPPAYQKGVMMSAPTYDSYEFRPGSSLGARGDDDFIPEDRSTGWHAADEINKSSVRLWGTSDEQKEAVDAWKAKDDKSIAVTQWHIHNQAVKARQELDGADGSSMSSYEPRNIRDMSTLSTTSRNLKVGTLTGEELATQLDQKHSSHIGWRPASAKQRATPLLASPPTGASLGSTFKPVPHPATKRLTTTRTDRPASARAALAAEINTIRALPAF